MGNIKTVIIALITSLQLIITSILPGAHTLLDTNAKISLDLPKQALSEGAHKII